MSCPAPARGPAALLLGAALVAAFVAPTGPPAPAPVRAVASYDAGIVDVPGVRPRDRGDAALASLRAELLDGLGVDSHHRAS